MVFVILVYDVSIERLNNIRKFLKTYLKWVQNSVFEGELSKSQYHSVVLNLKELVDENEDSILIYKLGNTYLMERKIIGVEKSDTSRII